MSCLPLLTKATRMPDSPALQDRVRRLQRFLKEEGYYDGKIDGDYYTGTARAVAAFQRARGIHDDGKAGPDTWGEYFEVKAGHGAEWPLTEGLVTASQLGEIAGRPEVRMDEYVQPLRTTFAKYNANTPLRQAHFLAQILHETHRFRYHEEIWGPTRQQKRYDPASGSSLSRELGNTAPGDGEKYKGRGAIMVTGKDNYRTFGRAAGADLVEHPERVADLPLFMEAAGWYWKTRDLNFWADRDDVERVTKLINGGLNGFEDRKRLLRRAKRVLGAERGAVA